MGDLIEFLAPGIGLESPGDAMCVLGIAPKTQGPKEGRRQTVTLWFSVEE